MAIPSKGIKIRDYYIATLVNERRYAARKLAKLVSMQL
jgi:hypothetical protein